MANSASMQTSPLAIYSESRISCQHGVRGFLRSPITITYRASVSSGPAWQSPSNSCRGVDDAHDWSRRWLGCESPPRAYWTKGRGVPRAGFSAESGHPPVDLSNARQRCVFLGSSWACLGFRFFARPKSLSCGSNLLAPPVSVFPLISK